MITIKKHFKSIALILSLLLFLSCSSDNDKDQDQGKCWTVLDAVTDAPIEGARVMTFQNPTNTNCQHLTRVNTRVITNENGVACEPTPEYFLCELQVTASGYVTKDFTYGNFPLIIRLTPD